MKYKLFIVIIALLLALTACQGAPPPETPTPAEEDIVVVSPAAADTEEPFSEFALIIEEKPLALGKQEGQFPWGFALEPESVWQHTWGGKEYYNIDCFALRLDYQMEIDSGLESLTGLKTHYEAYATPRGVKCGDTLAQLIAAYGDELVYSTAAMDAGGYYRDYTDVYAYAHDGNYLVFYLLKDQPGEASHINGIALLSLSGSHLYQADYITTFPLKNGQPDLHGQREHGIEDLLPVKAVYVSYMALSTLDLTAAEQADYRAQLFASLPQADWSEAGYLNASRNNEWTMDLFSWLGNLTMNEDELPGLLIPNGNGLDGIFADAYFNALARQFMAHPYALLKLIAEHEDWRHFSGGVSYGSYPRELELHALLMELQADTTLTADEQAVITHTLERMTDLYGN